MTKFSSILLWIALGSGLFASESIFAREESLRLAEREVRFEVLIGGQGDNGILFLSLHSNEKTSVDSLRYFLPQIGGKFVAIQASGDRRLHLAPGRTSVTIDPNRMFSPVGIERDLKRFSIPRPGDADRVEVFGKAVVERYLKPAKLVVALHNNTPNGFSILSYQPGGSEAASAGKIYVNTEHDPDNFFVVTVPAHFEALKRVGYNVVLQADEPVDDGSLSVFCGRSGIPYVNIEAEHGDVGMNRQMIRSLMKILGQPIPEAN
ncbi:MAG: hypothetical protein AAGA96_02540 [Verrucomicrobiota bacterium]